MWYLFADAKSTVPLGVDRVHYRSCPLCWLIFRARECLAVASPARAYASKLRVTCSAGVGMAQIVMWVETMQMHRLADNIVVGHWYMKWILICVLFDEVVYTAKVISLYVTLRILLRTNYGLGTTWWRKIITWRCSVSGDGGFTKAGGSMEFRVSS